MPDFVEKYINPFTDYGFKRLFEVAEIAKFSKAEAYEDSLKSYRDLKNSLDTAFEEGIARGIEQVAANGIKKGMKEELILELTGLTKEQLAYLRKKIKKGD